MKNSTKLTHLSLYFFYILLFALTFSSCDSVAPEQEKDQYLNRENLIKESLGYFNNQPYSKLAQVKKSEALLNELSKIDSTFSGLWLSSNEKNHFFISFSQKKNKQTKSTNSEIISFLENSLSDVRPASLDRQKEIQRKYSFSNAKYSFRELQYYRDLLNPQIRKRNDAVESFIDIKNNVFTIGILENANIDEYNSLIQTLSIPSNAVKVFKTGPVITAHKSVDSQKYKNEDVKDFTGDVPNSNVVGTTLKGRFNPIVS